MKQIFTLIVVGFIYAYNSVNAQIVLNEVYTDPGAGKNEFFELYNTSTSPVPVSMNNYTIVTYFEISGTTGFYVMDLPDLSVGPKGYFVGASALPFNYQGVTGSTNADFSWNSASFYANYGYVKKWVKSSLNLLDGNLYYDEQSIPANFNDFFYRRSSSGASYSIFIYKNGILNNTLIAATGGSGSVIPAIIAMPPLNVNMTGTSPDFNIFFSTYGSIPIETTTQDAGSDNGFIREKDGACNTWKKSSASVQHTPRKTNGPQDASTGNISVSSVINRGTAATGSKVTYDVVSGPVQNFPVEMQVYLDNGSVSGQLDNTDTYVQSNTELAVTDGPFTTVFFPYDSHILLVVKASAGCIDKVMFTPNMNLLPLQLISFQGNRNNQNVMLQWSIADNQNVKKINIEKSINEKDFITVGSVNATEKNDLENYSFNETVNAESPVTYRLLMVSKNNKSEYSKVLLFKSQQVNNRQLKIIENPVTNKLTLSFESSSNEQVQIKVYDMNGKMVINQSRKLYRGSNLYSFPLSTSDKSGIYIVELTNGSGRFSEKFVKQ